MSSPVKPDASERYALRMAALRQSPVAAAALVGANRVLTALFYVAFALLLGLVALSDPWRVLPVALVPAAAFVLVSAARKGMNEPRPYEVFGVEPLIAREGAGCSFPSRHAFSAFVIAVSWLVASVPVACGLIACACALAWCRVLGGVHFPRDVVAGAAAGIAAGVATCALAIPLI